MLGNLNMPKMEMVSVIYFSDSKYQESLSS